MKIIIEIGHPAHVHNFKYMIQHLESNGHNVKICTTDKDLTLPLLKALGFNYDILGTNKSGNPFKKLSLFVKAEYRMWSIAKKFKPDLFVSRGSPFSAHISKILGKPHIVFNDTECAILTDIITLPFTDIICTPLCFKKDYGKKHIRFDGYKELAYLHPNYFKPDPSVLSEIGLRENERYIITRFVAWQASHDIGQSGFDLAAKRRLVEELEKHARVFITSERPLPSEFEQYRIALPPEKIHSLLYYATLYLGEGATMATEAAVLGTPSLYVSSLAERLGNFGELENKYGLLYNFRDPEKAIQKAIELIQQADLKEKWAKKRQKLLSDKIDVTQFMVDFIENYPQSFYKHHNSGNKE